MARRATPLRLYGAESDAEPLPWEWVAGQLEAAGSYLVAEHGDDIFERVSSYWRRRQPEILASLDPR